VTDLDARPIEGAVVAHAGPPGGRCESDARGRYRLRVRGAADMTCTVLVSSAGFLPREYVVGPREPDRYDIRLTPAPRIAGTVSDAAGRPVGNYVLQASGGESVPLAMATSSPTGEFTLYARHDATRAGAVDGVALQRPRSARRAPAGAVGDRDVRLVVREPGSLELRVQDAAGNAVAATAYGVRLLHHDHPTLDGWNDQTLLRAEPDAVAFRIAMTPGAVSFVVVPDAADLQPSAMVAMHVAEGRTEVRDVVLQKARVLRVLARDRATGTPVAGAGVTVVRPDASGRGQGDATLPYTIEAAGVRMLSWRSSGVLAKGLTGADGVALVRLPSDGGEATLACAHPTYRTWSMPSFANSAPEVTAELDRASRVRGTSTPPPILAFRPALRVVVDAGGKEVAPGWVAVDPQSAAFELLFEGGPARLDLALNLDGAGSVLTGLGVHALARTADGAPLDESVVLDVAKFLPGTLGGTVFVDGKAARSVRAHRVDRGVAVPGWAAEGQVGADGSFRIAPMLAGDWWLEAVPVATTRKLAELPVFYARTSVASGQTIMVAGDVKTMQAEMVVVDANGAALAAGQKVTVAVVSCPDKRLPYTLTDAGLLRLAALPIDESVIVQAMGGVDDAQRGEAAVTAKRVALR
jgi:hypothetical protein